ncbi:MAG: ParB/RepB/Spo0J family partition protein [Spirochaetaceae bacterium]|jgi:ParB family chromosome partitioning protein|nr:ParB/RepB/Spo0J family partition protein [Spirochaetaceae bacterium]
MAGIKFGLGDGIEALLPIGIDEEVDRIAGRNSDIMLPLDKISANPDQPRKNFDEDALKELAESIKQHGVIQPILVEEEKDGSYTVITGERRSRAARIAGLSEIPAIIRKFNNEQRIAVALVENIQRADLNPIEEAVAYKHLMEAANISQDQAALRLGKKRSTLANAMRLLKLPPPMQDALKTGGLSAGHARAILSLDSEAAQQQLFSEILTEGISVREAEKRTVTLNKSAVSGKLPKLTPPNTLPKTDPEIAGITQKFIEALGTKVSIDGSVSKGYIRIEYFNEEDLKRIYDIIMHNAV